MLNVENAKKWVEALRSGKYQQAQGRMRSFTYGGGFCCLGVAAEVACLPGHEPYAEVAEWLGLKQNILSGEHGTDGEYVRLNDALGKTFSEIADIIEQHIKEAA